MDVYPIYLNNLHGRRCVVFGGGHAGEAERKVESLIECGADVTVVSREFSAELAAHADVEWIPRGYVPGDLDGAFLAIVSETNPPRTKPIWEEAQRHNVLINAMDDVPHCTFVAGSVVRRGKLTLSISTSGAAPALSVRLRQRFQEEFGPHYSIFLDWMAALRDPMAAHHPDFDARRSLWYEIVDSDVLDLLGEGRERAARESLRQLVGDEIVIEAGLTDSVNEPFTQEVW
ncbi:MAG: bifunctional precorrin-2 dehydrogenase/sirohydrochlorin ferrochelatase [Rhodothermales bacterium]